MSSQLNSVYRYQARQRNGVALILTLAVLVLLSALVLAFFSTAILHREISFSSSGQNRAGILAKTAMDTTVGDLISEIQAGSTSYTTNGVTIYIPTSYATKAGTMVPSRTVPSALTNLITVSQGGTNIWWSPPSTTAYSPPTGPARASSDAHYLVTAPSVNGRYLPASVWQKPELLDTGAVSQFPTPSWILITRNGPVASGASIGTAPLTLSAMANSSSANPSYVIGRYAYAVYDVGGLVDANVAGNGLTSAQNAQRGRLHQAVLGELPLVDSTPGDGANLAAAATLVSWRSATGQSDTSWLFNPTNNFTSVDPAGTTPTSSPTSSDQAFVTRQDLIQYFQNGQSGLSANCLQYLTVFSRELNQPSYTPPPLTATAFPALPAAGTRPKLQGVALGGNTYGIGNGSLTVSGSVPAGLDDKFNPSLVNMRLPLASGNGASIFKQRFPLSRLAWITANGPSATLAATDPTIVQLLADGVSQQTINNGTATNILAYFGLAWDSTNHQWIYTSPEGTGLTPATSINYLSSIPAARTTGPDFFETLQASIAIGSLGRDAGSGMISNVLNQDQNVYRHILQIGANIIDGARPDDFPAAYRIGVTPTTTTVVYGNKDLPYLTRLNLLYVNDYVKYVVNGYIAPEVWNPNQQVNVPPTTARPTALRIRACLDPDNPNTVTSACNITFNPGSSSPSSDYVTTDLHADAPIQFTLAGVPAITPTLLTVNNSTGGSCWNATSPTSTSAPDKVYFGDQPWNVGSVTSNEPSTMLYEYLYGFFCGTATAKDTHSAISNITAYNSTNKNQHYSYQATFTAASASNSFVLEYTPDGTNWYPYAAVRNIQNYWQSYSGEFGSDPLSGSDQFNGRTGTELHIDPRTDRFGLIGRWCNSGYYGGLEYDTFTSQTLWHYCYSISPPVPVADNSADWRFVGEMGPFPANANSTGASTGGVPTADVSTLGAFHLQTTIAISAVALQNTKGPPPQPGRGIFLETIADNIGPLSSTKTSFASPNYYYDPDGIVRPAAGGYSMVTLSQDGRPMAMAPFTSSATYPPTTPFSMNTSSVAGLSSQPIVPDRPYRSVGELAYIFRDVPWKDIDFFTTFSGDAPLLDAFSVNDTSAAVAAGTPPVVAGLVNLNTQNSVVLQALLMGAIRDDSSTASANQISQADATALASLLITRTGNLKTAGMGPLVSKADLTLKFAGDLTSGSHTVVSTNGPDWVIKARREAAIRALADAGQVRTWNLMIDLVVQAGKYTPTASTGDQFEVEGEKHYWLHVALDRFTGQVVDELLEPVYD